MSFDHHSAQYDLQVTAQQFILIGDHLVQFPCARCLMKHYNTALAYISEGAQLDGAAGYMDVFRKAQEMAQRHLDKIVSCTVGEKCELNDIENMKEELRTMRDFIIARIYLGQEKTEQHDITGEHSHVHQVEG